MKNCKNCLANNTWFDIYLINTVANNYKIKLFISGVQLLIVQLATSIWSHNLEQIARYIGIWVNCSVTQNGAEVYTEGYVK